MTSVVDEARRLIAEGVREITLLGQNVNSYADKSETDGEKTAKKTTSAAGGRRTPRDSPPSTRRNARARTRSLISSPPSPPSTSSVACVSRHRIRRISPTTSFLRIAETPNVCKQLHVPAQSGSTTTLERMRRGYTREAYDRLIQRIRAMMPHVALSSDFISGFCGETEDEHAATLDLLERVEYEQAFMFHYSRRDKTRAARHFEDDVPEETKKRRLAEVIETFRRRASLVTASAVGRTWC